MTIYLSVEPKDIKISSLILNLFFNCAIKMNLSENPDFKPDLKYNLLMILDEFPQAYWSYSLCQRSSRLYHRLQITVTYNFSKMCPSLTKYTVCKVAKHYLLIIPTKLSLPQTSKMMMLNIFQMK